MDEEKVSNFEQAKKLSEEILTDLEINDTSIDLILRKTVRLARTLHDTDGQRWLFYETDGYPKKFDVEEIGKYKKYYQGSFTYTEPKSKEQTNIGLPILENILQAFSMDTMLKSNTSSASEKTAALEFTIRGKKFFERAKSAIHHYVTEINISLSVGEIAQDIFQESRDSVDEFISENCDPVFSQLIAINDRMKENDSESYSQALLTVRRILMIVADSIFPPQDNPYIDETGKKREVGKEQYLNRILAYVEQNSQKNSGSDMIEVNLTHLSDRIDLINDKACKGVHNIVSRDEARLIIIQMYLLIAEIAKIKKQNNKR